MLLREPNRSVELVGLGLSLALLFSVSCEGPSQRWKDAECVPNDPDKPPCPDGTICLTEDYRCHTLCDKEDSSLCPLEQACFPEGVCRDYEAECDASNPCMGDFYCEASTHSCRKKSGLGAACSSNDACWSGVCQDGYCCASCSESCMACAQALTGQPSGTCASILAGKKRGEEDCPDPLSCDGAGGCTTKGPGEPCAADLECTSSFCSPDGVCCDEACDASGCVACTEESTGVASGTCADVLEGLNPFGTCAGALACRGDGECYDKADGTACNESYECTTGNCLDGYCCASDCSGICNACAQTWTDEPNGTCAPARGGSDPHGECGADGCDGSAAACAKGAAAGVFCVDGSQCLSNWCVDGVCCESSCDRTCEACISERSGEPDGACAPIPLFQDPEGECLSAGGSGCTGASACKTAVKVMAVDAQKGDHFGRSVAIAGNYALVGAPYEKGGSGDPGTKTGAAYVYDRTGRDAWDAGTRLVARDVQAFDTYGGSVAISGDYAIVGSDGEDGDDPGSGAGAAYVFRRTGVNTWGADTKLVAPDAQAGDRMGVSVAISGGYAIVGAFGENGGSGDPRPGQGAAYVFGRTGVDAWDAGTKLVAPDAQSGDHFGQSVAISGDYAIVGSEGEDGGAGDPRSDAGAAYVFHRTEAHGWDGGTKLIAPDAQSGDDFGCSVAISGDYAVVGARWEDGGAGDPHQMAGAAYVFRRTGLNAWDAGTKLVAPDGNTEDRADDRFGGSVGLSGDYAVVGASWESGGDGNPLGYAGAAYIFRCTGGNAWDAVARLSASDARASDYFGYSVAIDGSRAIVGADQQDGESGHLLYDAGAAYIY